MSNCRFCGAEHAPEKAWCPQCNQPVEAEAKRTIEREIDAFAGTLIKKPKPPRPTAPSAAASPPVVSTPQTPPAPSPTPPPPISVPQTPPVPAPASAPSPIVHEAETVVAVVAPVPDPAAPVRDQIPTRVGLSAPVGTPENTSYNPRTYLLIGGAIGLVLLLALAGVAYAVWRYFG